MRYSLIVALMLMIGLVYFTGCPSSSSDGERVVKTPPAHTPAADSADEAVDETAEGEEPAPPSDEDTEPVADSAALPTEFATPSADQLEGEWIGLFGRGRFEIIEQAWTEGHHLKFDRDGHLVWTIFSGGQAGESMDSSWSLTRETLKVTFPAEMAKHIGLADIAPLSMGRDEEIGLQSVGRDQEIGLESTGRDVEVGVESASRDIEIGLESTGGEQGQGKVVEAMMNVMVDGDFLYLKDQYSDKQMVYARVDGGSAATPQGDWDGFITERNDVQASLTPAEDKLTGKVDDFGQLNLERVAEGYFVGRYKTTKGLSFAAVYVNEDGDINGVCLPDPFREVSSHFDFTPRG